MEGRIGHASMIIGLGTAMHAKCHVAAGMI